MNLQDAVALTRDLLRFDTVNPPGREGDCARHARAFGKRLAGTPGKAGFVGS